MIDPKPYSIYVRGTIGLYGGYLRVYWCLLTTPALSSPGCGVPCPMSANWINLCLLHFSGGKVRKIRDPCRSSLPDLETTQG